MPFHIRLLRDALEKDAVYRLRALLASEAEGAPVNASFSMEALTDGKRGEPRSLDRFDAYDGTTSLLALEGGTPVGTLRMVMGTPHGLPGMPTLQGSLDTALLDRLAVRAGWQQRRSLLQVLIKVGIRHVRRLGATQVLVQAPHYARSMLEDMGFVPGPGERFSASMAALRPSLLEVHEAERVEPLVEGCDRSVYVRGEPIFRRGGAADMVYVVARGRVLLAAPGAMGRSLAVGILGPGDLLGEEAGIGTGGRRYLDAIADAEETDVWCRPRAEFVDRLDHDAATRQAFLRALGERLRMLAQPMAARSPEAVRGGVLDILVDLSARFCSPDGVGPIFLSRCSPRWLAEQLGCAEEVVGKVLTSLEAEGVLTVRRDRVVLLQPAMLATLQSSASYQGEEAPREALPEAVGMLKAR